MQNTTEFTKGELYAICELCDIIKDNPSVLDNIKSTGDLTYGDFYSKEHILSLINKINTMCDTAVATNQRLHDYTMQEQVMLQAKIIAQAHELSDMNVDNTLSVHASKLADNEYAIDIYKYQTDETLDDPNHDCDSDYIDSITVKL